MLDLTPAMEQALARRSATVPTVLRKPIYLYEFYPPDHYPAEGVMFDPADAIADGLFSEVSIVWLGNAYRKLALGRGSISKHITGEYNGCSVNFTNVGPDNSKPMSEFVLSHDISGLRLVIRYIDKAKSATLADSVILYVGRAFDPDTTSSEECSIPSKEDLGAILHEIPKREFRPDDPLGRSPDDPLFEGIRTNTRKGINYYTEQVTTRVWGFLWRQTKDRQASLQFSAENDGHVGDILPWINGRVQMEGVPVSWVDEGKTVRALYIFAGSLLDAITDIKCQSEGFTLQAPPDGPPTTIIALGDPGGTGTNAAVDINFAAVGYLSGTAYVVAHFVGSSVDNVDDAPVLTAMLFGRTELPDSSGHFTLFGRSDNPAYIARHTLIDKFAMGIHPGLIGDASFVRVAQLCDQYIKEETNSEILAITPETMAAMQTGEVTRYTSGSQVTSKWHDYQLGVTARVPGIDDNDPRGEPIDPNDPHNPTPPVPVDPNLPPIVVNPVVNYRRRFTFNAPLTSKVKASDFLYNMLFAASRLFHKTGQDGRINIDMERPADSAYLMLDAPIGDDFIIVSDIEPWRISLRGEVLIGAGLVTSELRRITATEYDSALGNGITILVVSGGSTTLTLISGGPTFIGGTPTVPAQAIIQVGGVASPGSQVSVTIDNHTVSWTMDSFDDTITIAAAVAMIINSDKFLQDYVHALWDGASQVAVHSKMGKMTLDAVLTNVHDSQLESPTTAPTATVLSGGTIPPGTWDLAYSWQSALGETLISPRFQVTIVEGSGNYRIQTGALVMPTGAASVNWYMSLSPINSALRFNSNAPSGASHLINDPPLYSSRKEPAFNDAGEETIRCLFSWGPDNIREGTRVEWPLSGRSDAVNQVYIEYISAVDDFATKQLTVNDYEHQSRTGVVNRHEVNGRGIDSYDQAVRIANAVLAFKRDGNFLIKCTVDEAGLPYEEGDVGCVTDDSGLWQQPVRVEHIDIEADGDVTFTTRIYATHMMQDLTGQKEIALSSPLKYVTAAPPPVSNVVLVELPPTLAGDVYISRIHGTFDFGEYIGRQRAHVYIKLAGESEYQIADNVAPSLENKGVFDIVNLPRTVVGSPHFIKIVTESPYGKTSGLTLATAYPVDLLPVSPTLIKFFDNVIPRDSYTDVLGLTVGIARSNPLDIWYGTDLWRYRGWSYEKFGTLKTESTMGHTTTGGIGWLGTETGYNEVWVQQESGAPFTDATPDEIAQGKNNYFFGREKLGVQHWAETPAGSKLWHGTGLVRGLNHTEIFKASHIAQEDVILLDENIYFLPCIEHRDLTRELKFKAVSILEDIDDTTEVVIPYVRGDSMRPYAVSDYSGVRDSSFDWFIQFAGYATPNQIPEWYVEVYADNTFTLPYKRRLPVVVGTAMACTLEATSIGEEGVVKNNVYSGTVNPTNAVTIQSILNTRTRFDFNMRWIGEDHQLYLPISFEKFIKDAHLGPLNRPPNPTEIADWTSDLTTAYGDPDPDVFLDACRGLVSDVFASAEYDAPSVDNDVFINDCYQAFLQRNSEPAGHAFWLNETILYGKPNTVFAFAMSSEFHHEIVDVLQPAADPSRRIMVALQTKGNIIPDAIPATPDLSQCPLAIQWEAAILHGAVAERVFNYETAIFEEAAFSDLRNQVDPGYALSKEARGVSGRTGQRYTFLLSGSEYRVYNFYVAGSGQKPMARCSAPAGGFPFPLRLIVAIKDSVTGALCVENITIAGDLLPATIYPDDQQEFDFSAIQDTIYVKIYQRGKYPNLEGFPIYMTASI